MKKSKSAHDSFSKILVSIFGVAFFLLLGVLLYATSTNTDLRSKAALEEKVYKSWEFEDMNLEGWDIKSKSGSPVGVGDGQVQFTVDKAGVVLTHKKVKVKMDKGQKIMKLAVKTMAGSWTPESTEGGGPAGGMMPYRPDDTVAVSLEGKVEYKIAGKSGWEKDLKLSGTTFTGEKAIFTADFPQIGAVIIEELKITLTSVRPFALVMDSIVLAAPVIQVKPTIIPVFEPVEPTVRTSPKPGVGPATPMKKGSGGFACIQVITPARNEQTGACQTFSTPCDVPVGWVADSSCPAGSWTRE